MLTEKIKCEYCAVITSVELISIELQQTQSSGILDKTAVVILSKRLENFSVWEIELVYLLPHNSAWRRWKPLSCGIDDVFITV